MVQGHSQNVNSDNFITVLSGSNNWISACFSSWLQQKEIPRHCLSCWYVMKYKYSMQTRALGAGWRSQLVFSCQISLGDCVCSVRLCNSHRFIEIPCKKTCSISFNLIFPNCLATEIVLQEISLISQGTPMFQEI